MPYTDEWEAERLVVDFSKDAPNYYFCTPCKIDFRKEEDMKVHLKTKDHKRNKRYQKKIYNRRVFGGKEEGPLIMSEPETSEEEDETTKYEREVRLINNLCVHKGYGYSCRKCVKKRMDMEEKGNFDFVKIGKHLETIYHRMVEDYGDDPSIPSSASDELGDEIFEKADELVDTLAKYEKAGLDEEDQEAEEDEKDQEAEEDKKADGNKGDGISKDEVQSRFEEILQDPESGYDNWLPRLESIDDENIAVSNSDSEEEAWKEFNEDPFKMVDEMRPSLHDPLLGQIRFSKKIKKIPLYDLNLLRAYYTYIL